jgi:hypothetical protein
MKSHFLLGILLSLGVFLSSCGETTESTATSEANTREMPGTSDNMLTEAEKAEGWKLLFDGQSMNQWRLYKRDSLAGWAIVDGQMQALGKKGLSADIITKDTYQDFELSVDWKISEAGNSGIFFNVVEAEDLNGVSESGPEYQLIDDEGFPADLADWQKTGANYAMHTAPTAKPNPVGAYNTSKIKVTDGHVEHWLNGEKLLEYDMWTDEWRDRIKAGKWKDYPQYGQAKSGHIALQDHGNQIWFKNIKIREL